MSSREPRIKIKSPSGRPVTVIRDSDTDYEVPISVDSREDLEIVRIPTNTTTTSPTMSGSEYDYYDDEDPDFGKQLAGTRTTSSAMNDIEPDAGVGLELQQIVATGAPGEHKQLAQSLMRASYTNEQPHMLYSQLTQANVLLKEDQRKRASGNPLYSPNTRYQLEQVRAAVLCDFITGSVAIPSRDVAILNVKTNQLQVALDSSVSDLKRDFIASIERFYSNLEGVASGNVMPYGHRLEKLEKVSEIGHGFHIAASLAETGLELAERLGAGLPKFLHLAQPAMACAFSVAFPVIPLIAGTYTIYTNEKLIKQAKKLTRNMAKFSTSEKRVIYEHLFYSLCELLHMNIKHSLPVLSLPKGAKQRISTNFRPGMANSDLWVNVLLNFAIGGLCDMQKMGSVKDVNEFIANWKQCINCYVQVRGNIMNEVKANYQLEQLRHAVTVKRLLLGDLSEQELKLAYRTPLKKKPEDFVHTFFLNFSTQVLDKSYSLANSTFRAIFLRTRVRELRSLHGRIGLVNDYLNRNAAELTTGSNLFQLQLCIGLVMGFISDISKRNHWHDALFNFVIDNHGEIGRWHLEANDDGYKVVRYIDDKQNHLEARLTASKQRITELEETIEQRVADAVEGQLEGAYARGRAEGAEQRARLQQQVDELEQRNNGLVQQLAEVNAQAERREQQALEREQASKAEIRANAEADMAKLRAEAKAREAMLRAEAGARVDEVRAEAEARDAKTQSELQALRELILAQGLTGNRGGSRPSGDEVAPAGGKGASPRMF